MFRFFYYKTIRVAMNHGYIKKRKAVYLYNILKHGKLTCEICKQPINKRNKKLKASIYHILPICKGGNEQFKNLRVAHRFCNERKGAR